MLVVPLTVGAACADRVGAKRGNAVVGTDVQMNDVSILYPMAKSLDESAGLLAPSSAGLGGTLFPSPYTGTRPAHRHR
jgi:hypothetical protein